MAKILVEIGRGEVGVSFLVVVEKEGEAGAFEDFVVMEAEEVVEVAATPVPQS